MSPVSFFFETQSAGRRRPGGLNLQRLLLLQRSSLNPNVNQRRDCPGGRSPSRTRVRRDAFFLFLSSSPREVPSLPMVQREQVRSKRLRLFSLKWLMCIQTHKSFRPDFNTHDTYKLM